MSCGSSSGSSSLGVAHTSISTHHYEKVPVDPDSRRIDLSPDDVNRLGYVLCAQHCHQYCLNTLQGRIMERKHCKHLRVKGKPCRHLLAPHNFGMSSKIAESASGTDPMDKSLSADEVDVMFEYIFHPEQPSLAADRPPLVIIKDHNHMTKQSIYCTLPEGVTGTLPLASKTALMPFCCRGNHN